MKKIVVATQQGGLEDQVSPVFGRCQTYTVVEVEEGKIKNSRVFQNEYINTMSGAGIQAAGFVTNQNAEAVISGNFGPNVTSVLNQSGVKMVPVSGMNVKEAVENYLQGELQPVSQATIPAKRGIGRGGGRGMGGEMKNQRMQHTPQELISENSQQEKRKPPQNKR
ncbi:MAG: NifB/NifX family molybdenum-iron cluster-binding protein [Candidatus Hadarchaeota archaeon]